MIRIATLTYTGTSAGQEILGGGGPDFALTKRVNGAATVAYTAWRDMPRNAANSPAGLFSSKTNQLTDLTKDGIYVGGGQSQAGALYAAILIKGLRGSRHFATGCYSTNNTDGRNLTGREGCGFQPDFVWLQRRTDGQGNAVIRHKSHEGDQAQTPTGAATSNLIQAFLSDGFQVGNSPTVNGAAADLVDWWALREVPGAVAIGHFDGSGAARLVPLPFQPTAVLVKNRDTADPMMILTQGMVDNAIACQPVTAAAGDAQGVTGFNQAGFTVGTAASCNGAGNRILYVALRDGVAYPGLS